MVMAYLHVTSLSASRVSCGLLPGQTGVGGGGGDGGGAVAEIQVRCHGELTEGGVGRGLGPS